MKRRQRRPVLEISKSQGGSHGEYLQSKYKQITSEHPGQNVPANPLANLLCQYNSDSDTEDSKKDVRKLDDQVNNFLKEIQLIAPTEAVANDLNQSTIATASTTAITTTTNAYTVQPSNQQAQMWRECLDESSGYPYYWHIETNEVTWEMPEELRALKNDAKINSVLKAPPVQESHWVDFSAITYQQTHENIPEGMIPREVVARNRNRYIRKEVVEKAEMPAEQDNANTSDAMDDDSDDGRIEMITSYGSDESDSDTAENNQSCTELSAVPVSEPTNSDSTSTTKPKGIEVLPSVTLPQLPETSQKHNQEHENKTIARLEISDSKFSEDKDSLRDSKNQVNQRSTVDENKYTNIVSKGTIDSKSISESHATNSCEENVGKKRDVEGDLDFRVSLVPGYDEDSEAEDETEVKEERKALFPIPQSEDLLDTVSLPCKDTQKQSAIDGVRVSDSNDSDTSISEKKNLDEQEDDGIQRKDEQGEDTLKTEDDTQKSNMFLEDLRGRNKCFQRKRRIAFDVTSAKTKVSDDNESKMENEVQQSEGNVCNDIESRDTDSQKEVCVEQSKECDESTEDTVIESVKCDFKGESNNTEETGTRCKTPSEVKEDEQDDKEVSLLSQIILEKLKFLSEGKPGVSPVQLMAIQLQTLSAAWEGGHLEKDYLSKWLTETSHELERLEQEAAPPGWLCQWDRSHKRYYYHNPTTGVTQWTYPDTGIAGGTEEMEICSTPPPAEQEDMISEPIDAKKISTTSKPKLSNDNEVSENREGRASDIEAPPPPQISNPSPPPPPRIFAEDLKKDKRKRDKGNDKLNNKKKRLGEDGTIVDGKEPETLLGTSSESTTSQSPLPPQTTIIPNIANTEPLPPGVDLTEAPYEIPATALKRIIYNTVQQQGTTLYDATPRDPTVSILGHPAIVQEHYLQYPAYHQHIHAPPAIVLSHKHTVQPAIQLIPDYTPIYTTNRKVIEKPPVKTQKESLVSALDSFYNDIARIEKSGPEQMPQRQDVPPVENTSIPPEEAKLETEQESVVTEPQFKEKKKKKTRIGISKKHKEVSSMVAKWQKAQQNFEENA